MPVILTEGYLSLEPDMYWHSNCWVMFVSLKLQTMKECLYGAAAANAASDLPTDGALEPKKIFAGTPAVFWHLPQGEEG